VRAVIINADDFGYSEHTVHWTVQCFEAGVLSSATIMVGADAVEKAVSFAKANNQWSYGLHLVLSDERPISAPETIPTMVTPHGLLWPTRMFMLRSALGLIKRADLEKEIRVQVQRFREYGLDMSHLDGHGHMHRMPFVLKSLIRLSEELKIHRLRPAQDVYFSTPRVPVGQWLNRFANRTLKQHFKTPDHFLMTSGKVGPNQSEWFRDATQNLPDGITEIGIHPGVDEPWRELDTSFVLEHGRSVLEQAQVRLVSYHDVN
jgi:predicted glycoside hydrolase/deacetylase ChbG (UPF0249 family)